MANPLVSILIPCFNAEAYVGAAIESALAQTYKNVEVIVVDDGSTDGGLKVIQSYGERIRWEAGPKHGACAARNRALQLSQGEFIQFVDADDVLGPTKIERQLPPLQADEADLVFCKGTLFGGSRPERPLKKPSGSPEGIDSFVYCVRQGLGTEGPLHRRKCLEAVGGFREHLPKAQEADLHIRLGATDVRLQLVDEILYRHRDADSAQRITRTPMQPGYLCQVGLEIADIIESGPPYRMTDERRRVWGNAIYQQAIYAYRDGAVELARRGFERALSLSPDPDYDERRWYKTLVRCFGPMSTEHLLATARRFLRRREPA